MELLRSEYEPPERIVFFRQENIQIFEPGWAVLLLLSNERQIKQKLELH